MTLLATSDDALLRAAALLLRWGEGYVEPAVAPALPAHLLGQQLLALTLQEGVIGQHTWRPWFGTPFVFGDDVLAAAPDVTEHLLTNGYLTDSGAGMLVIGDAAEADFGRRHFMELLAVFTAPPLFSVRHGATEIGQVPDEALLTRPPGQHNGPSVLLLAGKNWKIVSIDWKRRLVTVEPSEDRGVARWLGGGVHLGSAIATGVRDVLCGADPVHVQLSRRAVERLAAIRAEHRWQKSGATTVVTEPSGKVTWWTFAGGRANMWLAQALSSLRTQVLGTDGLTIDLDAGTSADSVRDALATTDWSTLSLAEWVSSEAIDNLKFADTLPRSLAVAEVTQRLRDDASRDATVALPVNSVVLSV